MPELTSLPAPAGSQLRALKVHAFDSAAPYADFAVPVADILAASAVGIYPEATAQVPKGLALDTDTAHTPGSGGTDGVFEATWSGGNFTVNPKARFKVRNGRIDWFEIDGPGLCVNASPSAPMVSLSASSGLTGASVPFRIAALVESGATWWADHASDATLWQLYRNNAGTAAALSGRTEPKNVAAALATEVAAAEAAKVGAEAAQAAATVLVNDIAGAQYKSSTVIGVANPAAGTAASANNYVLATPITDGDLLFGFTIWCNAGTISYGKSSKSGDNFTPVGTWVSRTVTAGKNVIVFDTPWVFTGGLRFGWYQATQVVHYGTVSEATAHFYSGSGTAGVFTDAAASTSYPMQISLDVRRLAVTAARMTGAETDITALEAQKAPLVPPLAAPTYRSAIRNRYGANSSTHPVAYYQNAPVAVHSADVYAAYGEPNVIRVSATAASADYKPEINIIVTVADLARINIVPSDSAPQLISARAAILLANLAGETITTTANDGYGQVMIGLRYNDADSTAANGFSASYQDVVFINGVTGISGSYFVPSPNPFSAVTGRLLSDTACLKGYAREGIPVLATLNGKALSKIIIKIYGRNAAAGALSMDIARLALVAGATIDDNDNYLSPAELQESIGSSAVTAAKKVTLFNASRIAVDGNSYSESYYTQKGKHWIANASAFTDYNWENFAVSGETYVSNLGRIRSGATTYGNKTWKDYGVTYALGMHATNDPFYGTYAHFLDDVRATCETVKATGAIPIIATEFLPGKFGGEYQLGLKPEVERHGGIFWDILPNARNFDISASRDAELWGSGHPGQRTNGLISSPITRMVQSLPRPARALKLFRKRAGVTVSSIDDLRYPADDHFARHAIWQEIDMGHEALTSGAAKYVDQLATGTLAHELIQSEYLKLQSGVALSFTDYCLVDAIIDGTQQTVDWAALVINDPTATVYVYDGLATPYESSTRYQRFEVTGSPTIVVGDTYTSSDTDLAGTFTVVGISGTNLIMSPLDAERTLEGAGTLTRTSGTGSASISYTLSMPGYEPAYYDNLGKPEGHWTAVTGDGTGRFKVSDLRGRMAFDRIRFLIVKASLSLTKCEVEYDGPGGKPDLPVKSLARAKGAEMLTQTLCGTSGQLANWTVVGSLTAGKVAGDNSGTPYGTTGYVTVTAANRLRQTFTFTASTEEARTAEIVVKARYFPGIVNSGTYPTGASLTPDSLDFRQIEVSLIDGSVTAPARATVGLWWRHVVIPVEIPAFATSLTLDIGAVSDGIQVAGASVKLMQ